MSTKPYWHEITQQEVYSLMQRKVTYQQLFEMYLQPKWCGYPNALLGKSGCWTLIDLTKRSNISADSCRSCDAFVGDNTEDKV